MRIKTFLLILSFMVVFTSKGMAVLENPYEDKNLNAIYEKAEQAIQTGDESLADFYLARYMGLTILDKKTEKNVTDLYPLFKAHKVSAPTSFISGKYSKDFIDWFVTASYQQWGRDDDEDIDVETKSFGITSSSDNKYFATIIGSPFVEGWSIINGEETTLAPMALIDFVNKPYLVVGIHDNGEPKKMIEQVNIDAGEHPIQHIWPIEFHDLDNDGIPEIWIRYNMTWASGFSQVLDIYAIKNDEKVFLLKRFEGEAEGIARRLDDGNVEVAFGFTEKEATGHLGYDQHHIETFELKDGEFTKIAERNVPHLLWGDEWLKYYFKQQEGQE